MIKNINNIIGGDGGGREYNWIAELTESSKLITIVV